MTIRFLFTGFVAAGFLLLGSASLAQEGSSGVPWMLLPSEVRQTIKKHVGTGNRMQKVVQRQEENRTVYVATITGGDGTIRMMKVSSTGQMLGTVIRQEKEEDDEEKSGPDYAAMSLDDVRKAAVLGDAKAQYWMGKFHTEGRADGERNFAEAAAWFRKAAEQGDRQGQDALGRLYIDGRGVPQDYGEGYFWRLLGAKSDAEKAAAQEAVSLHLSPKQIFHIQKAVHRWRPGQGSPWGKSTE